MTTFDDFKLCEPLNLAIKKAGFSTPTPIQQQAIPHAMAGKDVLGSAQTGTGKTAAFGIPLANHILTEPRGNALILTPTRELAMQVHENLSQLLSEKRTKTALIIGGAPMPKQVQDLAKRPRLIVGTPGRVNDHLSRGSLMLNQTQFLVLDEMDRMLDMGFGVQIDEIVRFITAPHQTMMFSATMSDAILKVAQNYLTDPVRVSVGSTTATASQVTQVDLEMKDDEKFDTLLDEIEDRQGSIIVFVKTKFNAQKISDNLRKQRIKADCLHGDLRQNRRKQVTEAFNDRKFRILIATDIAARGLDISHIEHVINYDAPMQAEDYIHRIGRTGRAGATGEAVNFVTPKDYALWNEVKKLIDPKAALYDIPKRARKPRRRQGRKTASENPSRGMTSRTQDTPRDSKPSSRKPRPKFKQNDRQETTQQESSKDGEKRRRPPRKHTDQTQKTAGRTAQADASKKRRRPKSFSKSRNTSAPAA